MGSDDIETIAVLLKTSHRLSRRQAIIALGQSHNPQAIKYLDWSVRNETDEELRQLASQAIHTIRQSDIQTHPPILSKDAVIPSTPIGNSPNRQSPAAPNVHYKPNNQQTMQDNILLAVCFLLFVASLAMSFSLTPFIRADRVILANGEPFSDVIDKLKANFSAYDYLDQTTALEHINNVSGQFYIGDITRFYNRQNMVSQIIIPSEQLYWEYVNRLVQAPDNQWIHVKYSDEQKPVRDWVMGFMGINFAMAFCVMVTLLGLSKSYRALFVRLLRAILTALGMRVFWGVIFLMCLVEMGLLGMIYTQGIKQFLTDFFMVLGLDVLTIQTRDIVGWQFFLLFALWGTVATVVLGAVLFRPQIQQD